MNNFIKILATWWGTGYSPVASGTVGTLAAIPLYIILAPFSVSLYLTTLIAFFFLSCWISGRAEIIFQEKDSGKIVIDEVIGYLVTMTAIPYSWKYIIAGFILFRFFDIVKIQPAKWVDQKLKNGYGVVLDDVVAGIYAWLCMLVVVRVIK
ncbi:MAG: phosphatidylglycerophosphatase A [Desulfuromonadales bacterium]|nr:phosphatidylglycerophosphatase A [Desulfuromonadales bacterium]